MFERAREVERRLSQEQSKNTSLMRDIEQLKSEKHHLLEELKTMKEKYESKSEQTRKLGTTSPISY